MDRKKVIKGLEQCSQSTIKNSCKKCPYKEYDMHCTRRLTADAIALFDELEWWKHKTPVNEAIETLIENGWVQCTYNGVSFALIKQNIYEKEKKEFGFI